MKLLFDTHLILWSLEGNDKMPAKAKELLMDPDNDIFFSSVSIWEIAIKRKLRPEVFPYKPDEITVYCMDSGFDELTMKSWHTYVLDTLKRKDGSKPHKDPFDQMLIAQAKSDGLMLVTHDRLLADYEESCVLIV